MVLVVQYAYAGHAATDSACQHDFRCTPSHNDARLEQLCLHSGGEQLCRRVRIDVEKSAAMSPPAPDRAASTKQAVSIESGIRANCDACTILPPTDDNHYYSRNLA